MIILTPEQEEVGRGRIRPIQSVANATKDDMLSTLMEPSYPMILTNDLKQQRCYGKWSFDFFADMFGASKIMLQDDIWSPSVKISVPFTEFVAYTKDRQNSKLYRLEKGQPLYTWDFQPFFTYPDLMRDIADPACIDNWFSKLEPFLGKLPRSYAGRWLFVGPAGTLSRFHRDYTSAWLAQCVGRKRCMLVSPDDAPFLLNNPSDPSSADIDHFFACSNTTLYVGDLNPGEFLIMPHNWWHQVEPQTPTITVSFNFLNAVNLEAVRSDLINACPEMTDALDQLADLGRCHGN